MSIGLNRYLTTKDKKGKGGDQSRLVQLYNLADDIGETKKLDAAEPGRVENMKALFEKLITDGRSAPGGTQKNDVEVKRYPAGAAAPRKAKASK